MRICLETPDVPKAVRFTPIVLMCEVADGAGDEAAGCACVAPREGAPPRPRDRLGAFLGGIGTGES